MSNTARSTFCIAYGSTDGHTQQIAVRLKEKLDSLTPHGQEGIELLDIGEYHLEALLEYDGIILGVPTWNSGQLQRDWEAAMEEFEEIDLTGRPVAIFGLGDQVGYPDTFVDAMIFVADQVRKRGGRLVGVWPTTGYSYHRSWAVENGYFVGLVVDEHNQPELTDARLQRWAAILLDEFAQ